MSNIYSGFTSYYLVRGDEQIKIGMSAGKQGGFAFNAHASRPNRYRNQRGFIKAMVKSNGYHITSFDGKYTHRMDLAWLFRFIDHSSGHKRKSISDLFEEGFKDSDGYAYLPMRDMHSLTRR